MDDSIVDEVVVRLRRLSSEQQQVVLEFVDLLVEWCDLSIRKPLTEAEIEAMHHGPFRSAAESEAAFRARHGLVDGPDLTEDERQARLDAEYAALSPGKRAILAAIGLI